MWATGKVESSRQVDVVYGGEPLASQTRYYWQVRVWDGEGDESDWSTSSWFETGILAASEWQGDWIGKSTAGEIDNWTNYSADFDFDIKDLNFGVFIRAKDTSNGYMWQISTDDGTGVPKLRPHKRVKKAYTLLASKPIPGITSADLLSGTHRLSVAVVGNTITTRLDGNQIDQRTDATFGKGFVGFRQDTGESAHVKHVKVTSLDASGVPGGVLFESDLTGPSNPFSAGTMGPDGLLVEKLDALLLDKDGNRPLLRKEFSTEPSKTVARARVYASAHGTYELQLNGESVGDQHLAPGWTEYRKRIQYQTYDVTDQINSGANALAAEVGDGWWGGKVGKWGPGLYGSALGLIAQLRIDYTDGTTQIVKTDGSWKSHFGPYIQADNIDGETYDANSEQPGWNYPNFNDSMWHAASVGTSDTAKLVPQPDEPVRTIEELPALRRSDSPGEQNAYLYDVGQNMVGVARVRIQGVAGQTVKIRYAEQLTKDGQFYAGSLGGAKATDYYTFKTAGTVVYTPKFTQHGFRYVQVSGAAVAPEVGDVTGIVWGSDLKATGTLESSNAMFNQLQSNISWGQRGNFLSVPTDTPARDERLGWTGDINVFAPTASYLRDTRAFLSKWTTDLRDSVLPTGNFPGVAPVPPGWDPKHGVGWADAGITVPYAVWHAQGDTAIVRQNYSAMKTFFDFVQQGAGSDLIDSARGRWNDWLNLNDDTGVDVVGTAYFAEDARMLSEMAAAIGEHADAAEYKSLSEDIREAFTTNLISADGTVEGGSQTAYAFALGMDLITDPVLREKVGERFVDKLKVTDFHLTTGFLGTPWLLPALTSINRSDLAYKMLQKKDYPSWGYEIENGATTMWERWDLVKPDGTIDDDSANSFNHYAYGAVADWMYENIGGIAAVSAGYKKSRISPAIDGGLTSGHGSYESVYGRISSDWKVMGDDLSIDVQIPVNTTSTVSVPAAHILAVSEGGKPLSRVEGVTNASFADGIASFTVGSGSYSFHVDGGLGAFGEIFDEIESIDGRADDLRQAGDLGAEEHDHLGADLDLAKSHVVSALEAHLDGDESQTTQDLGEGLAAVKDLRAWVGNSSIETPIQGELTKRLTKLESMFNNALASALGVSVVIPPLANPVQAGGKASGTLEISNSGASEIRAMDATVTVEGWDSKPAELSGDGLPPGDTVQIPFELDVPKKQGPGAFDASFVLHFTTDLGAFTLTDRGPWVNVESGVEITEVTWESPTAGNEELANIKATIKNHGSSTVAGVLSSELPSGWTVPPESEQISIEPGETKEVTLPLFVGLNVVNGNEDATVTFVEDGMAVATKAFALALDLPTPPNQAAMDRVDFGNTASETAHGILAAPKSGRSVEAGLDRRYAHGGYPGSWFSAEYQVTPDKPFLIRNIETFDSAITKKFNIYVDETLVKTQLLKQTLAGETSKAYQVVVDSPAAIAETSDGKVRIKYEYPTDAAGFGDPSIADSWVLAVPEDEIAPLVSASVSSSAAAGNDGWYRGDATVKVTAADNRGTPAIETGATDGWQPYVAPIVISGDGKHQLSYRAKDSSDNSTGERKVPVWIDSTAPSTQIAVNRGAGVEGSDTASVKLTAVDDLSGVSSTAYRLDGGAWSLLGEESPKVEGYGKHTVEYFSTDTAGNPELLRTTVIDLADVDTIASIAPPQVLGTPAYGARLTATYGTWNTKGLDLSMQWLRNGVIVAGKTGTTYKLGSADLGKRMSVKVIARKDGKSGDSTSLSTNPVAKAKTTATVSYSRSSVKKNQTVRLSIKVTSAAITPRGTVRIYENGKRVKSLTLHSSGRVTYSLRLKKKGLRSIKVIYVGSHLFSPDNSPTRKIRVR